MPKIGFALRLHVDGLTAVFLLLAALIAVPASFYSIAYMRHYEDYGVARYYPYFLLFLAAMYGLLSTTDMMWFFFIFWQMMTLPGYALIRFENRKAENIRAANKYLIMMQIACAATMIGAELLAVTGAAAQGGANLKYDFDTVSANLPLLLSTRPLATGAGLRALPRRLWNQDGHVALRPDLASGCAPGRAFSGERHALRRDDQDWRLRLDALFSLAGSGGRGEQIIPLGRVGNGRLPSWALSRFLPAPCRRSSRNNPSACLPSTASGRSATSCWVRVLAWRCCPHRTGGDRRWRPLAFFGALFHVLNHGLFKGLLFLNAGSMLHATGTQDLNQMGGLMKFMPLTAVTALVASFSISGVPLFNGFVSKWMHLCRERSRERRRPDIWSICAVIAILTSALTLASFIKFFGVSFLSRTSSAGKERRRRARAARSSLDDAAAAGDAGARSAFCWESFRRSAFGLAAARARRPAGRVLASALADGGIAARGRAARASGMATSAAVLRHWRWRRSWA